MTNQSLSKDLAIVEQEFKAYIEKIEAPFDRFLNKNKREIDAYANPLKTLYLYFNHLADKDFFNESHPGTKMIMAKTASDILAIYQCVNSGLPHQAAQLMRGLFETGLNVKFIHADFETRMDLFYDHRFVQRYEKIKENPEEYLSVPEFEELKQAYNRVKGDYKPKSYWYTKLLQQLLQADPSLAKKRPSLKSMSLLIGKEGLYNAIYSSGSLATHSSSALNHLFIAGGRHTSSPVYDLETLSPIIGNTLMFATEVLELSLADSSVENDHIESYTKHLGMFLVEKSERGL